MTAHPADVDPNDPASWRLIDAAASGDASAFIVLWETHRDRIVAYVRRHVNDRHLAEDITSETFVRAWKNLDRMEDRGRPPITWLMTVARNLSVDHFKSSTWRTTTTSGALPEIETDNRTIWGYSPEESEAVAMARVDARIIADYLDRLPQPQRDVIRLRFYVGLSIIQTAAIVGVTEGAAKGIQHRAVASLRRLMERDGHRSPADFVVRPAA